MVEKKESSIIILLFTPLLFSVIIFIFAMMDRLVVALMVESRFVDRRPLVLLGRSVRISYQFLQCKSFYNKVKRDERHDGKRDLQCVCVNIFVHFKITFNA